MLELIKIILYFGGVSFIISAALIFIVLILHKFYSNIGLTISSIFYIVGTLLIFGLAYRYIIFSLILIIPVIISIFMLKFNEPNHQI